MLLTDPNSIGDSATRSASQASADDQHAPSTGGGDTNGGANSNSNSSSGSGSDQGGSANQLVSPYGEDAPRISPLLVLPVNRHPVFPGFMVSQCDILI